MDDVKVRSNPLADLKTRGWVSLRGFCGVADITYPTALRWAKLGMIQFTQVGGQKRIYEDEIARFLQFGTLPPNPEAQKAERDKREAKQQHGT